MRKRASSHAYPIVCLCLAVLLLGESSPVLAAPKKHTPTHSARRYAKAKPVHPTQTAHAAHPVPTLPALTPAQQASRAIAAGDTALAANNDQGAFASYKSAVSIAQNANLGATQMLALAKLGQAYLQTKDYSDAIDSLTRAQSVVNKPSVTDPILNAKIYTLLAKSYLGHEDYKQADDTVSTGLPFFDALLSQDESPALDRTQVKPVATAAAQLAYAGGSADMMLDDYNDAVARFMLARTYVDKAGEKGGLMDADALAAIADADVDLKKWPDAVTNDTEAIDIYTKLGNTRGERPALADRAASYSQQRDFAKAADSYASLLKLVQADDETATVAHVAQVLGLDYVQLRDFDNAKKAYTTAANASLKLGDKENAALDNIGVGVACEGLRDFTDAIAAYNAALPQYLSINDYGNAGAVMLNLGGAYQQLHQPKDAMDAYSQASDYFTKAGDAQSAKVASQRAQAEVGAMIGQP